MRSSGQSPPEGQSRGALPPLIVIAGATATGKTGLSLELAERLGNTEIISADSRQVYRGMDIGTAKVSPADRRRVPHHGLDLAEPDERFTAQQFRAHALEALQGIAQRGGTAILVGGTGLYLRAVARGLPLDETGADAQLRAALEARLESEGLTALAAELQKLAPAVAAATDLRNPRRVVRALERVGVRGDRPPPPPVGYPGPSVWLGLTVQADVHRRWIEDRARLQFEGGLIEEAEGLRARFDPGAPAFSAFGYREAFAVLDGRMSTEQAVAETVRRTRQFARRQRTWFRAEPGVTWLDAAAAPLAEALAHAGELQPLRRRLQQ